MSNKLLTLKSLQEINKKNKDGNTILHFAAVSSSAKTVKLLIEKGAEVNAKNDKGETPLHRAAYRGRVKNVKEIIKAGGDINARDNNESTPLHHAAMLSSRGNRNGKIKELISAGAEINAQNKKQRTPLIEAVYIISDIESIRTLIRSGCDINVEDYLGHKALRYAHMDNDKRVVKMLIEAEGSKERSKIGEGYKNIKPREIYKARLKEIESRSYEEINEKNKDGETILHLAIIYGSAEGVKELIEKGADINIEDNKGKKALHYAALLKKIKKVKILIEKGANVNATCNSEQTPLHLACSTGSIGVVRVLVNAGADINAVNMFGESPLYCARRRAKIVNLLQKKGAEIINERKDIVDKADNIVDEMGDALERLALPEVEGKMIDFDEIKKRGKSLIGKDLLEAYKKSINLVNKFTKELNGKKDV